MLRLYRKTIPAFPAVFLWLLFVGSASAAVLTVTTNNDTDDSVCDAQCSLREAAAAAAPGDTIIFARELRGSTIQLTKALLIDKRLTVDGPNKRRITLKGNNTFRIIHLKVSGTGRVVTLDGLIIRDGQEASGDGGGIYVDPALAMTLNITNCAILNNTAQHGGGIYISGSASNLYLSDSTVAGNIATAENSAGGIDVFRSTVRIFNSTISGNKSTSTIDGAGAIRLTGSDDWSINGSTIAYNSTDGAAQTSAGGLVALNGVPGPLSNVILAKNTGINPDYQGRSSGARNSLIGITDQTSGFINGMNGNVVGSAANPANPQLGVLTADNGGGLPTHALLSTSPAIDAGNNAFAFTRAGLPQLTDQRGFHRIVNSTIDMGAYEFNAQPAAASSAVNGQVKGANGRGVSGAQVVLQAPNGETKFAFTNPFGFYRFVNVKADATYTIRCLDKRNNFAAQNVLIEESIEIINFQAN
jgi:CSLREA domain-containing protein